MFDKEVKHGYLFCNVSNFMPKKKAQEAKGQVHESYRQQLLKVQKKVEDATKFSEKGIRRILRQQKGHEPQVTKSITYSGSNRVPQRVADTRHSKIPHSVQNACFFMCSKERFQLYKNRSRNSETIISLKAINVACGKQRRNFDFSRRRRQTTGTCWSSQGSTMKDVSIT